MYRFILMLLILHIKRIVRKLVLLALSVFISCNNHKDDAGNIFCYNESAGISSLDPAFAKNQSNIWVVHQLFNTLVITDEDLNIIPSLAKSWEFSADKKEIRFLLRQDIYFHDHPAFFNGVGRKMIAADVVYSFERLMDSETASPGAWIFRNRIDSIKPFTAINDSIFILRLSKPFVQILGVLSNKYCSVVPREAVEYKALSFRDHPIGTGPFKFFKWEEGEAMILKRNSNYFEKDQKGRKLPYLDGIRISFINNKATEFLEFRQGKFDFVNDIEPSFKDEILLKSGKLKKEWEGVISLHTGPYLNTEYLGILMNQNGDSALRNKSVRKAISLAIDKRKLMLYLRNSVGTPAEKGLVPPELLQNNNVQYGYVYDPVKAKQLLQESGFNETHPLPPIYMTTVPTYADLASYIAKELKSIGIKMNIAVVPKSLLLTQIANNDVKFFRGSWIADYPDAENFLSLFYSKNPSPPNYTRYENPRFDELYVRCLYEENIDKRTVLYRQMDSLVMEDAPVIPLWYDQVIHLVQPNVKGFRPHPLNLLDLRRVRKE
jgi:oligopeptide transport system substrate-binding protein